jgi:hypothetical protein
MLCGFSGECVLVEAQGYIKVGDVFKYAIRPEVWNIQVFWYILVTYFVQTEIRIHKMALTAEVLNNFGKFGTQKFAIYVYVS